MASVFLFAPNVIGYFRIVLLLLSCYYMRTNCELTIAAYILSCLLDAVDGHTARLFNQSTKFGAMLDMIVDRCTTMCLLACLVLFYPSFCFLFQISMIIDIASHWLHLHSSILIGRSSHKFIDLAANPLLKLYYTNRVILFSMCAGNELFYTMLYVCHFTTGPVVFFIGLWKLLAILSAPIAIIKSSISLIQLHAACLNMVSVDEAELEQIKSS